MIKFGTGGWRAIIGDDLTRENIQILAKALADKMKAERVADKGLVIGYDRRFLSKETVKWSCEVFAAEGIVVHFVCQSVPTPLIMNYVMKHGYPYGMMVTASHNPSLYNGIKVFIRGGRDADVSITRTFEERIEKGVDVTVSMMQKCRLKFPCGWHLPSVSTPILFFQASVWHHFLNFKTQGISIVISVLKLFFFFKLI